MTKLTEWLTSIKGIVDVKPMQINIKGTSYEAASYIDTNNLGPNGRVERIYALGPLPACYRRSSHTAFRLPDDQRDWYVACYIETNRITPENSKYHPLGESFMLAPWEVPSGELIDAHNYVRGEYRSYNRVPVQINP